MNYTFITKSEDQIKELINHLNREINKEAHPTLSEASDLLKQVVEKFESIRKESKLNIDLMRTMVEQNRNELNQMFPHNNNNFVCYETKFSVSVTYKSNLRNRNFGNTRDYEEAITFLEKEFKNANIDSRSFKIQRFYSTEYMTLEFSLPKEVDTEIFMNQLRNVHLYFSDIMDESINQLEAFSNFSGAVRTCTDLIRLNQTNRYNISALPNQTINSITKGQKGKTLYKSPSGMEIEFVIKDNELVFTMPNKKHITLTRKIRQVKEALIQYV